MMMNPLKSLLVTHGLHPIYSKRYRHDWNALNNTWVQMAREVYDRPMVEDSNAFWVSLRRLFPGASMCVQQ